MGQRVWRLLGLWRGHGRLSHAGIQNCHSELQQVWSVEMSWSHSFNCRMPSSVFPSLVFLLISVTNFHLNECSGFTVFLWLNWSLFAYSHFAYSRFANFRQKSGVSPTHKKLYLGIKVMSNCILKYRLVFENVFGPCHSEILCYNWMSDSESVTAVKHCQ